MPKLLGVREMHTRVYTTDQSSPLEERSNRRGPTYPLPLSLLDVVTNYLSTRTNLAYWNLTLLVSLKTPMCHHRVQKNRLQSLTLNKFNIVNIFLHRIEFLKKRTQLFENWISVWRMVSSAILRHVALVKADVSEERSASIVRVTRIGELGTMLAVTRNRRTLRLLVTAKVFPSLLILVTLMMEELRSSETSALTRATRR
jgi:hypothetical protein